MRKPVVYILAPQTNPDGSPIRSLNQETFNAIEDRLNEMGIAVNCPAETVWPEEVVKNEHEQRTLITTIYGRRGDLISRSDVVLQVPGWQDCRIARREKELADYTCRPFYDLMKGYDGLKEMVFNLVAKRA